MKLTASGWQQKKEKGGYNWLQHIIIDNGFNTSSICLQGVYQITTDYDSGRIA